MNVGDFLIERLCDWGVTRIYGYPATASAGSWARSRAENQIEFVRASRGDGGFMACASRSSRATSGLPRDFRSRSDPPAERPLRREARPSAGRRDRRPAGPRCARRELPAGGRSARSSKTWRTSTCTRSPTRCRFATSSTAQCGSRTPNGRSPASVIPNDVQTMDAVEQPEHEHATIHSSIGFPDRGSCRTKATCEWQPSC